MVTIIFTSQSSGRKKRRGSSKRLEQAKAKHGKEIARLLGKSPLNAGRERPNYMPDLSVSQPAGLAGTSDSVPVPDNKGSYSRDLFFRLYREGSEERTETLLEVQRKAKSVGPAYNKGGLVYQTRDPSEYKKVK